MPPSSFAPPRPCHAALRHMRRCDTHTPPQISIADSQDWDASPAPGPGQRPGRFEMAGSERSSFLFDDDHERFEMLRVG